MAGRARGKIAGGSNPAAIRLLCSLIRIGLACPQIGGRYWLRGRDSNPRPMSYEPIALTGLRYPAKQWQRDRNGHAAVPLGGLMQVVP